MKPCARSTRDYEIYYAGICGSKLFGACRSKPPSREMQRPLCIRWRRKAAFPHPLARISFPTYPSTELGSTLGGDHPCRQHRDAKRLEIKFEETLVLFHSLLMKQAPRQWCQRRRLRALKQASVHWCVCRSHRRRYSLDTATCLLPMRDTKVDRDAPDTRRKFVSSHARFKRDGGIMYAVWPPSIRPMNRKKGTAGTLPAALFRNRQEKGLVASLQMKVMG